MPAAPDPEPPKLRLPGGAAPTAYRAELSIDPARDSFRGTIEIDLRLDSETPFLWLNATALKISAASARLRIIA